MTYGIVYGLYHPLTNELRYVGQTKKALPRRLAGHVSAARYLKGRYVLNWTKGLLALGLKPLIRGLAEASSQEELDQLEMQLIAKARAEGADLTNHADGGQGTSGVSRPLSPEHKAKLHSPEVRAKMAATRKGQPSPRKGVTLGEEIRAKISASKAGVYVSLRRLDATDEIIVQMIQEGASSAEVAERLGITRHTVRNRLLRADSMGQSVPILARRRVREEVVRRLQAGQQKEQILQDLQISSSAFDQHCSKARRAGVPILKVKPGPKSKKEWSNGSV